jgi:hypothetical protein
VTTLASIRVVEIGLVLAGLFAGAILADLGADVVKVEKPGGGDDARNMGLAFRHDDSLTLDGPIARSSWGSRAEVAGGNSLLPSVHGCGRLPHHRRGHATMIGSPFQCIGIVGCASRHPN